MTDAYTVLARCYDRLTGDVEYEKWADYLERHFRKLKRPVRSVVELGCGTGSLTRLLAERGYRMTAVDLSPDMLAVADQKCGGLGVLFLCQDMSRLALLEPADAVVSCLDSVNYVTDPKKLAEAFRRVHLFLTPGGLFLFDINSPEKLEGLDGQVFLDETEDTYCVWRAEFSKRSRICSYFMDIFRLDPATGQWARGEELHRERACTVPELTGLLEKAGFRDVRTWGELKMRSPGPGEQRVFFTARKDK